MSIEGLIAVMTLAIGAVFQRTQEATVEFATWIARVREMDRPYEAKRRKILDRWREHSEEESRRGHTVSTAPPDVVSEAWARLDAEQRGERQTFYKQRASAIGADLRSRRDRIDALWSQLQTEVSDCQNFEYRHRQFAAVCGVDMPVPIAPSYDAFNEAALLQWRSHTERVLNPPAPQQRTQRPPNVLTLD